MSSVSTAVPTPGVFATFPIQIARLRFYVMASFDMLDDPGNTAATARFVIAAQWRLQRLFPNETAIAAIKPFADLLIPEIEAGVRAGLLHSTDPAQDAWFITHVVGSIYHYSVFAPERSPTIAEDLWSSASVHSTEGPPDLNLVSESGRQPVPQGRENPSRAMSRQIVSTFRDR